MDMSKYLDLFVSEANEHIEAAGNDVSLLASGLRTSDSVNSLFRHFHSIKGMGATMGFAEITAVSHAAEDLVDHLRRSSGPAPEGLPAILMEALDAASRLVAEAAASKDRDPAFSDPVDLIDRIRAMLPAGGARGAAASPARMPDPPSSEPTPPAPAPRPCRPLSEPAATVRIPTASLDLFLDSLSDLVMRRGVLAEAIRGRDLMVARQALSEISDAVDRLRGQVMRIRMIPFEHISPRLKLAARDLCRRTGKTAELAIEGGQVSLDRSVLEDLLDPLQHLLRNAIDHGIEPPERRTASGKPAAGSLRIAVSRRSDEVLLRVEDDGGGMDTDAIRRAALSGGFVDPAGLAGMDDRQVLMLTTIPGFSTARDVTEISGRGVGMDVVRTRVEALRGRMSITSTPGKGTRVEMVLPLSVAVIDAFVVDSGAGTFAVPTGAVSRILLADPGRIRSSEDGLVLDPDRPASAAPLRLIGLGDDAGIDPGAERAPGRRQAVLAYEANGTARGLLVDRVAGRREVVVRPLGPPLERLRRYSGAALLDDGRVALILDLANLGGGS